MTLDKILNEEFKKQRNNEDSPRNYKEMIIKSLKEVENIEFKRKGKLNYAFSNDTVEI
ncbi:MULTISPECIES: hypothetical protein [unclassified Vibrio]|uniref:hypothetical protein n=1 Tax=unclassified Vibrio TaxID=2614977 RepID=UPI0012FFD3C9|nr:MULTISPECIES: hypothetical protein [unclassified Vibrio]